MSGTVTDDATPVLEVRGLTVRYGGVVAVDGVDLTVGDGEIVGLIGPNGAGKTSWIDAVTGFHRPAGGSVRFAGSDVTDASPHARARAGFVRTFQRLDLFEDLTVRQNLLVGASTPTWRDTLLDALWPRHHDEEGVDEALALLGLDDVAERNPAELSNGQRHLVALGRALAARPRLVLLDEPAAGLDEAESAALGLLLHDVRERGTAILLVDHDMALVLGVCDRVAVLDLGRCIATGRPADVRANPEVVAAYLGTEGHRTGETERDDREGGA
ncbi:MAG: ABC transporter ATP-binding protein [Acidimicrobiales bacterium]|nr:ABC transporter ATP-binding protein [Acidimicrobiales bacterium]